MNVYARSEFIYFLPIDKSYYVTLKYQFTNDIIVLQFNLAYAFVCRNAFNTEVIIVIKLTVINWHPSFLSLIKT